MSKRCTCKFHLYTKTQMLGTVVLMESVCPSSFPLACKKVVTVSEKHDLWLTKRRNSTRLGDGNATKSCRKFSMISSGRFAMKRIKHGTVASVTVGSLDSNPNYKKIQGDGSVKDRVSYGGSNSTTFMKMNEGIGVLNFIRGKNFFITGATGFLAKVLVEKILRTVPDVGKIFLLIRAENKQAANERLKSEIINSDLFKCLRQIHGNSYEHFMLSKLVSVVGNVREPNLGLEADVADVIRKEANIIVNSAATTDFRERYDVAIDINTRGPYLLMSFAKKCKKLELLLHVSTGKGRVMEEPLRIRRGESMAGENCINHETPASPYPTLDVNGEIKMALDYVDRDFKNKGLTRKMKELGLERARKYGWQDGYTLTKAMGEMLIEENKGDIPVVIVRPSVVESTYREPFPGWIEETRMMDPLILSYGKGELKGFPYDPKVVLDIIPVDMVVNATLAAMTRHGMAGKGDVDIYHIATSVANPLLLEDLASFVHDHFISTPWIDFEGRPIHVQPGKTFSSMDEFSADIWGHVIQRNGSATRVAANGKLPQKIESVCRKLVEKAKYLADIYEPYTFYAGRFDNSNSQRLMESLSEEEKKMFGFDVKSIDWKDYITNVHIPGLRNHVMKGKGLMPKD
ncbi:hypothetical protein I3843_10G023400 [Carya illinoinensis]|nr:hypothetical protein I3843_10G023400 [Carya illinoinensis]